MCPDKRRAFHETNVSGLHIRQKRDAGGIHELNFTEVEVQSPALRENAFARVAGLGYPGTSDTAFEAECDVMVDPFNLRDLEHKLQQCVGAIARFAPIGEVLAQLRAGAMQHNPQVVFRNVEPLADLAVGLLFDFVELENLGEP